MAGQKVFFLTLLSMWISRISSQPTLIDFDDSQESSSLRQISTTLDILTKQTKALSLTVQQMQEDISTKFAKVTSATEVLSEEFGEIKTDISETVDKISSNINTNIRTEIMGLDSVLSQRISGFQDSVFQALFNQSNELSRLVTAVVNSSTAAEFDPALFIDKMATVLNDSITKPFTRMLVSKLSVVDAATGAVNRLVVGMRKNTAAIETTLQQEVGKVRDQVELVLTQITSGLLQRLENRTLNTAVKIGQLIPEVNSAIDDIVKSIQVNEQEQSENTKNVILDVSTALKESILAGLASNQQGFADLFSRANISGGLASIRQTVRSQGMYLNRTVTEIIQTASPNLQTGTLRLVNGTEYTNGRVEILYRGEWGTICDDSFGSDDAAVICRQIGWCGGTPKLGGVFGTGEANVQINLDDLECSGREVNILLCRSSTLGTHNCQHEEDVGVSCRYC